MLAFKLVIAMMPYLSLRGKIFLKEMVKMTMTVAFSSLHVAFLPNMVFGPVFRGGWAAVTRPRAPSGERAQQILLLSPFPHLDHRVLTDFQGQRGRGCY